MSLKTRAKDLADIQEILVNRSLPQRERIIEYVRQIKDPYHFMSGKFEINAHYKEGGPSFEECLRQIKG